MLYGSQGIFVPINDFIENSGNNIGEVFERYPQIKEWNTSSDGNIYNLPQAVECYHCTMSQKMWIYKPWLEKLGLEMPTTTEEFYQVLKTFKTQDPNGNGKADEIPLTASPDIWNGPLDSFLMNAFVLNNIMQTPRGISLNEGVLEVAYTKPAYREGLGYLRKLYAEGLIAPETFTQNGDQLASLGTAPEVVVGAFNGALSFQMVEVPVKASAPDSRFANYVIVPPLKGPDGLQVAPLNNIDGIPRCFITAAAEDPELAYRWCEAQEVADIEATIERYVGEMLSRFTIGDADLETEWETYTQTLEQMGLPRILEIYQTVYEAQK